MNALRFRRKSTLITDGAYSGKENHDLAAQKNIRLINTDLSGKPVDDILADFVFNETGTKVVRCPAGYEPKSCGYTGDKSQQFHVSFQKEITVCKLSTQSAVQGENL